jgi:hypothetical protein
MRFTPEPLNRNNVFEQTQALFHTLQSQLKGPLVSLWQMNDWMLTEEECIALRYALQKVATGGTLTLFLRTRGGQMTVALKMAHMLHDLFQHLVFLIPLNATSAATALALSAHEVHMGVLGSLSPIDVRIYDELSPRGPEELPTYVSEESLRWVFQLLENQYAGTKEPFLKDLFPHIHPLVLGRIKRAVDLSERIGLEALQRREGIEDPDPTLVETLNRAFPSHEYPICRERARAIGFPIKNLELTQEDLLLELHRCYATLCQPSSVYLNPDECYSRDISSVIEVSGQLMFYQLERRKKYVKSRKSWEDLRSEVGWQVQTGLQDCHPWFF